ncbi:MAG: cation transporter [Bacilli bacterium]|nr:cation transporter [Bacilli bacterium]
MKLELKTLRYSMFNNLAIAIIKVLGGIYFGLGSLFADGLHTFSDFVTDIVSMIGSKISKKRPTKYHPFGFGKVEYLSNLFVGFLLFALGIFIIINGLSGEVEVPPLSVLIVLVITFILKLVAIVKMHKVGENINSVTLITSVQKSKANLYSTLGVFIITILLQFSNKIPILGYADMIGSIVIGLIVLKTALKIIISNSLSVIGEIDYDKEKIEQVKEVLNEYKKVLDSDIKLIMYDSYYKLQLTVVLNQKLTLAQAEKLVKEIKSSIIRKKNLRIKYVTIYIVESI